MIELLRSLLHRGAFASMDDRVEVPVRSFIRSARLGLWPAIALSVSAFAWLLQYDLMSGLAVAASLCLIASVGFLLNDTLDQAIDRANDVHRWSMQTPRDVVLFAAAVALCMAAILLAARQLSIAASLMLVSAAIVSVAYSIVLKRVLLVGNVAAAGLSISPGLLFYLDTIIGRRPVSAAATTAAACLVCAGFVFLLAREIRFDEYDRTGDRIGGRLTLPMVLGHRSLYALHLGLGLVAAGLLSGPVAAFGAHSPATNMVLAGAIGAAFCGLLMLAYGSRSKTVFYKATRAAMLLLPVSIFLGF
jgi:4-hydroxybenzoate polyprenyltransferase